MPWHITKQGDRHCVVEGESGPGKTVKCHATRDEALAHLRALYANVPDAKPRAEITPDEWTLEMQLLASQFDLQHPFTSRVIQLEPAGVALEAQVAETQYQKARGMIGRTFDGFDAMLFTYERPVSHAFHMRGVSIPLLVAFFDADGGFISSEFLEPGSSQVATCARPFQFVLELSADAGIDLEGQRLDLG